DRDVAKKRRPLDRRFGILSQRGQFLQRRVEQSDHLLRGQKFRQPFLRFRQRDIPDRRRVDDVAPYQKPVKRSERAKTELNRGAAQTAAAEKTQVTPEIIALQILPNRRLPMFRPVPTAKFLQRLAVIAPRVNRRAAFGHQLSEKLPDPFITDIGTDMVRFRFHARVSRRGTGRQPRVSTRGNRAANLTSWSDA